MTFLGTLLRPSVVSNASDVCTTPKSEKLGQYGKRKIKKESSDSKFTLTCISLQTYEHKIFHVLSGQLHVICKYTSFPVIRPATHSKKSLDSKAFTTL